MPELPEVETVRQTLLEFLPGLTVTQVTINLPRIIKYPSPQQFAQEIVGLTFCDIERRGKYLKFILSAGKTLVIHLRMTGQLRYSTSDAPLPRHTHVIFELSNGWQLRYTDIRQFGTMYLASHQEIAQIAGMDRLGWEPLSDFPLPEFAALLEKRKTSIKSVLLNQQIIAGIGNIYADEALFQAGIHPARAANSLTSDEVESLHHAVRQVLQAGVKMRGTSFSDYVDGLGRSGGFQHQLAVYGRKGESCPRCGCPIIREKIAGRGTHYCPLCQPTVDNVN